MFGGQDLQSGKMLTVNKDGILSGNSSHLNDLILGKYRRVLKVCFPKKAPNHVGFRTVTSQITGTP